MMFSTGVSIRNWTGVSFVLIVWNKSRTSIQKPILMVELGNQERSNTPETSTPNGNEGS